MSQSKEDRKICEMPGVPRPFYGFTPSPKSVSKPGVYIKGIKMPLISSISYLLQIST